VADAEDVGFKSPVGLEEKDEELKDAVQPDVDPAIADWFKVEQDETPSSVRNHESSDTETENDSDHEGLPADDGDEEWLKVEPSLGIASGSGFEKPTADSQVKPEDQFTSDVRMGESDTVMEYDENLIFKHLCFYLDTPDNSRKNGMAVKSKHEEVINKNFAEISGKITENGGKIVDLDEPKLTHVIVDKLDATRRVKLIERTSRPKRRRLVITEWVRDSLDEGTLLDEEEYVP